ncbi:Sec2p domain-containing protein [Mycena kentingensis (nom. inval.)]|nr:Sec2p domain-containing protein [Mycena kentingensis (nom. inval.)]
MPDTSDAPLKSPTPSVKSLAKPTSPHQHHASDTDAQEQLISTLRSQIQDLFSQVTQLNGKLVKSYDRVSDLEDDLHVSSAQVRQSTLKISQLELERTQHLSALNTGLLVEKSQVTAELTRLMEKATEEAAQRGQAETAKANIEKDLDDLSATLFAQANTMVAEARYAQSQADRRVDEAEAALKGAEEMVGMMQQQMQTLQTEKDEAELKAQDMRVIMGKGKWVDRRSSSGSGALVKETRLLSSHLPYQEFLLFVAHLRSVHPSSPNPPAMTTLLTMPFLARLSTEDSDPTVRLDLAPSLNWLSRRSVLSAIHAGQLTIEPMAASALLSESSSSGSISGLNNSNSSISCALCGVPILSASEPTLPSRPPTHPALNGATNVNSWSASVIKKTLSYTTTNGSPTPPPRSAARPTSQLLHAAPYPSQIYVFRVATPLPPPQPSVPPTRTASPSPFLPNVGVSRAAPTSPPPSAGLSNSLSALTQSTQSSPIYPLCTSGWCLTRLRSTCTLWAFVRSDVVNRVWEEEVPVIPQPPSATAANAPNGAPPPVPPRRRGLWGMASKLGERAVSWSGDAGKEKAKTDPTPPVPPPVQPAMSAPSRSTTPAPPLPRRSEGRNRSATVSRVAAPPPAPPPLPPRGTVPPVAEVESVAPAKLPEDIPKVDEVAEEIFKMPEEPPAVANIAPTLAIVAPSPTTPVLSPTITTLKAESVVQKRMSAHQVPLPDSRPATPSVDPTPALAPHPEATVSATPGAPPPIPRRAAGRPALHGPRPRTPNGSTPPRVESPAPVAAVVEEAAPKEEAVKIEEPVASPSKVEEPVASPEPVTAPTTPYLEEVPTTVATPEVTADVEEKAEAESEKAETVEEVARVESPVPEVPDKIAANRHEEDEEEESSKEEDPNGEVYIGDVTWEERTWKELVKLREEMFWARVGGVRN